jgi:hypothetical protein
MTPDDILAQFPGPIVLRSSRRKTLFILIGSIAFFALGIFFLGHEVSLKTTIGGWVLVVLFGICIIACAIHLVAPGVSALHLHREGFNYTSIFRRASFTWSDTKDFEVWTSHNNKLVAFDNFHSKKSWLKSVDTALMGRNTGLPGTYGVSAEDLVTVLNKWRERALATP